MKPFSIKPTQTDMQYIPAAASGENQTALIIEDPFEPTKNLGMNISFFGLVRLKEELARAEGLCAKQASLSELLEPWVPGERSTNDPDNGPDSEAEAPQKPAQ